jgi:hypothetical protein
MRMNLYLRLRSSSHKCDAAQPCEGEGKQKGISEHWAQARQDVFSKMSRQVIRGILGRSA